MRFANRLAHGVASGLLLAAAVLAGGCGGGTSGLLGGASAADAPGGLSNDNPQARPVAVAWTAARAQRCGFFFDPARLRAAYLSYEAGQTQPDQLAKTEKLYDSTYKAIRERVATDPEYCSETKTAEIKADLKRHLAGDFTPNFPKAKKVETCGFLGVACAETSSGPWDTKKFWDDQAKNSTR
jgi:hypothetical protein